MPIKILPASGSGSATLISVAGTTTNDTLTLPARTGNIITSADSVTVTQAMLASNVAGNGPAFSAYRSTSQTITTNVDTKIQLNSVTSPGFNIGNQFDAVTNYRFTPTVAGYYQFSYGLLGNGSTGTTLVIAQIFVNGSVYLAIQQNGNYVFGGSGFVDGVSTGSALLYLNGTGDYVELYGRVAGSGTVTTTAARLSGVLVRAA